VTSLTKITFFHYIRLICEKTTQDIEITLIARYYEIRYGLSNDTKMSSQLHPFPPNLVVKDVKKREKADFPLSSYKIMLQFATEKDLADKLSSDKIINRLTSISPVLRKYLLWS